MQSSAIWLFLQLYFRFDVLLIVENEEAEEMFPKFKYFRIGINSYSIYKIRAIAY
ncbi:hypothetical protein QT971_01400 [Microcoleus sp. herbarium19]|uniref:hypothetical protein n=1 Tax=unclassified Microcoleus TaxID=2642155 RepID=UPI002FCF5080